MFGVKNLICYQQNIVVESGIVFWNMFEVMGGEGSMVELVYVKFFLVNYDYIYINFWGGCYLVGLLYEILIYGKEQYERRKVYEVEQMVGGVDFFVFWCLVGLGIGFFVSLFVGG